MTALSAFTAVLFTSAFSFFLSCNDAGNSKKEKKEQDTPPTVTTGLPVTKDTPPPPPPSELPPGVEMKPATMCFENEGLKHSLMIRIQYITENRATVEVTSSEIGSNKKQRTTKPTSGVSGCILSTLVSKTIFNSLS
jgi:hypothetical protein